ncbi:GNAT family N-acetyltransferase [Clostridium sp. Cult2]|uniref:GNAT family N-acetyltransferase n=1 Tax=Clostridium sp. Cult2 TaxID=2079003 RepID=UPI001F3B60C7|nr:GNAT family N-acetyltransferase [Clostridium sp. Cult2]
MLIRNMTEEDIDNCVNIFGDAYSKEPWNETYDLDKVREFLKKFTLNNIYIGWVVLKGHQTIGFAIGIIMPSIGKDYFKIEDICIRPDMQGKGIGRQLIKKITLELKNKDIDSIMLNTIKEFPAYRFYLMNGFDEIKSSSTMILGT